MVKMAKVFIFVFLFVCMVFLFSFQLQAEDVNLSNSKIVEFIGEAASDRVGFSVSSAGDVNGDGYGDVLIGADENGDNGAAYLIYGQAASLSTIFSLDSADVKFIGEAADDEAGIGVSGAGDVNNDGYDDILIGADSNDDGAANGGAVYLIYGQASKFSGNYNLSTANAEFTAEGDVDQAGYSLASANDMNNDGYDDFIIGARYSDEAALSAGAVYIVYGQSAKFSGTISLSLANAEFTGENSADFAGDSIASAGDVNADGYDDILIGAYANDDAANNAGKTYLIYGQSAKFSGTISLSAASAGFTGEGVDDNAGTAVNSAGDVNADGYDDILIGASNNSDGADSAGAAYVIYGKASNFSGTISLAQADAQFNGLAEYEWAGFNLASAGDANNDGYDDIIIGAFGDDNAGAQAGAAYLLFGQADKFSGMISLSNANARFLGETALDWAGISVSGAGDVNNDNFTDILIGASKNDDGGLDSGSAYLGYVYIDSDNDGVAGSSGLLSGIDCNDADAAVSANQTYYLDPDADGLGDPNNATTVCSATPPSGYVANDDEDDADNDGAPDAYENLDPADEAVAAASISSVVGAKNGKIKVTYINNSSYKYTVFSNLTATKKTKVLQYIDTAYYLVLQPSGKKLALVNALNGETLSLKKITEKAYSINALKLFSIRNNKLATIISKNNSHVRLSIVKVNINRTKLIIKDSQTINNKFIRVGKTRSRKNYIILYDEENTVIATYYVNKNLLLMIK